MRRGEADEKPSGITVELAHELGRRLGLPVHFRHYDKAEAVSDGAGHDEWDICFLAVDPKRAEKIAFSDPYVLIEGAFLVRKDSPAKTPDDVDRQQVKIGAVKGSAYELHLSRTGKGGRLTRFLSLSEAIAALERGEIDGLAGVRQAMQRVANSHSDFQLMPEAFMTIQQAVGVSAKKQTAARYVRAFVKEMKASGFVKEALARNGHAGVVVPPA
ncbi:transporter substrate-binding domain-containing protein [Chelativorans salis]|uniref:Transporter substrate-binding domain-containing protein n=1 Tax=Chelativorans salis TaxID=2978478 RepID=A0ABT2LQA3_9HYPH|nr:transporter substrate-binding domain-containing protein [Chelativorans sp. EGI FJ00035]MCT7376732.1 transporter substrate-binding domain-containing protein [Chelativorans sp. EGI FJ00035]